MNKDLKLLLISLTIFLLVCIVAISNARRHCYEIKYQDLEGTHVKSICEEK